MLRTSFFGFFIHIMGVCPFLLFASCAVSKSTVTDPVPTEYVLLDSLVITPDLYSVPEVDEAPQVTATRSIDLLHTTLALSPNWENQTLHGIATLSLTPFAYPIDTLVLNAQFFDVHLVTVNESQRVNYLYDGRLLRIPLAESVQPGQEIMCSISYTTHSNKAVSRQKQGLFFIDPFDTIPNLPRQIWTIGETQTNSQWFPTIDIPNERQTQDIFITVDTQFVTISNGLLVSSEILDSGLRTDHWVMAQSHAPYLSLLVVGEYDVVSDRWNGIPLNYYVDKGYGTSARDIFAHTPEMLSFFSELLDYPYPWPKFDQVIVHEFTAGAMENTSAVTFASYVQNHSRELLVSGENDGIVAHEMFHQWFGDLLTCESWSHIVLNEGFANYGEYLWNEFKYGIDEAQCARMEELRGYLRAAEHGVHPLIEFNFDDPDDLFDAHSYNKGSLVLHHLRHVLGDTVFFKGLRKYVRDHAFQSVEIHDLRLAMEAVSGKDLNWFFNQWYFNAGHPVVSISEHYHTDTGEIEITISQQQDPGNSQGVFRFPLTIQMLYEDHSEFARVFVHEREQSFTMVAPVKPEAMVYDPEGSIPWRLLPLERTADQYRRLIEHENGWIARSEGFLYLAGHLDSLSSEDLHYALEDTDWAFRRMVLNALDLNTNREMGHDVLEVALNDPDSRVRLAAAVCLGKTGDPQYAKVFAGLITPKSKVHEISTGLEQLARCDLALSVDYAKSLESDNSAVILAAIAGVYAVDGVPEYRQFFRGAALQGGIRKKPFYRDYAQWTAHQDEMLIIDEANFLKTLALDRKQELFLRFFSVYTLWSIQKLLPNESPVVSLVTQTISDIRQLNESQILARWYQSFD